MEKRAQKIVKKLSFVLGLFAIGVLIAGCSHLGQEVAVAFHDRRLSDLSR